MPIIKRYTKGLKFIGSGYLPIGKIDFGPWPDFFNINDIEGVRMGMGSRPISNLATNGYSKVTWPTALKIKILSIEAR